VNYKTLFLALILGSVRVSAEKSLDEFAKINIK